MTAITIAEALRQGTEQLSTRSPSASADAKLLLSSVLQQNTTYLYTWSDRLLDEPQQSQFNQLIKRRIDGEPVAYITGERGFWTFSLKTAPCTLIPREETECLVESALDLIQSDSAKVLDLGTGTGAIALALASERPNWQVFAADYQPQAVQLAKDNAECLQLSNVVVFQSDWFSALTADENSFDLIISNPPYIDPEDQHLQCGDLRFEPIGALAAGQSGFADINKIIDQAMDYLKPGGLLMIEHGYQQAEQVRARFSHRGYNTVSSGLDLAGQTRFSLGYKPLTSVKQALTFKSD